jgi:C-terminal processing protease CtpA/Prc
MRMWKLILPVTAILLFAGMANAQSEEEEELRAMESKKEAYAERLREAEVRMEIAAREVAELTQERLPQMLEFRSRMEFSNTPRIGITIDGVDESGPVEGVEIGGVTPESAADDAGLHAGDVITAVNGESMTAESSQDANKLLLKFMQGVEEGDELKVDYLRDGKAASVELSPRVKEMHAFTWAPDGQNLHIEGIPGVPNVIREFKFERGFPWVGSAWGSMELVELNEGLGKYFGTDTGLLVVSAPELDGVELKDGDVIQSIDGREPTDVRHAMRILSSYESGESLKLGIMRDKKKRTIEVEIPADQRGSLFAPPAAKPARVPLPPKPAPETAST